MACENWTDEEWIALGGAYDNDALVAAIGGMPWFSWQQNSQPASPPVPPPAPVTKLDLQKEYEDKANAADEKLTQLERLILWKKWFASSSDFRSATINDSINRALREEMKTRGRP